MSQTHQPAGTTCPLVGGEGVSVCVPPGWGREPVCLGVGGSITDQQSQTT